MKKWYRQLKVMFMLTLLLACVQKPMMIQAEEDLGDLSYKCGLEEFEVIYDDDFQYVTSDNKYSIQDEVRAYWTCFTNDYYYNQLSDAKKEIWDELENACIAYAVGYDSAEYVTVVFNNTISSDELKYLFWMFKYSNPQYYFLQNSLRLGSGGAGIKVYDAFQNGESRMSYTNMFCEKVNEWAAQVANAGREEEKVKLAHDIIANNTDYNFGSYDQSAYSMVCEGHTVCAGYAAALQLLLNPNGIMTTEVTSVDHAWNNVMVHGQWYAVDVTWDDSDTDYGVYYGYYLQSDASLKASSDYANESHTIEEMWYGYVPELKYDSVVCGWDYYSPYFTEGGYEYFTVNDNEDIDRLYAIVLGDEGSAPPEVTHNASTYRVMNVPEGRRIVPHYDIRENGGDWNENEMKYYLDGVMITDAFFCDGHDTYYLMADGTPMKDRLTYHPDGEHVIYFNTEGHEVFSDFAYVGYNIPDMSGNATPLNEYCFFDANGYQYTDVVTWGPNGTNREGKLYYANTGGILECGGWFTFSNTVKYAGDGTLWPAAGQRGYANEDCSLMQDAWTYDENNNYRYINTYGAVE